MNAQTHIDEHAQFDRTELDEVAVFNALGLTQDEGERLVDAWQICAPQATLPEFAKALVKGGMALARNMQP